jgi:hypothetical protein
MRKVYHLLAALVLSVLGTATASAGEMISLEEIPFWAHESGKWYPDAAKNTELPKGTEEIADEGSICYWIVGESCGMPYGDSKVNGMADLSNYTKLVVVVADGSPRFLFNRDVDEGQWNENEASSHLIDNTKGGWCSKYFTSETTDDGTVWTVDLKQLVKDKGFAYLHAIKGANWQNVTVKSMMVEKPAKPVQVGWTNIINNGNMEGDDVSNFFTKTAQGDPLPSEIVDGVGVDGSRGIKVATTDRVQDPWDNQFWFRFNESLPAGTKYRVSFDYRADEDATIGTQAHAEPSDYIYWDMFGNLSFTNDWQTFTKEGEVTEAQATDQNKTKKFQSVAFNLNDDTHPGANNYYFDNIKLEIYKLGTSAQFFAEGVKVDFGFDTNLAELVQATKKPRLVYPEGCATVTANGKKIKISSVEAYADGRFYIFVGDDLNETDEVLVAFNNPADATYHIKYTSGAVAGQDVTDFADVQAAYDEEPEEDAYPYTLVTPVVIAADPENGSFNLPNSIKDFKVTFDKPADCAKIKATLNGKAMTVTPADGFAEQITMTREGDEDLPTGEYTINITKIYPEAILAEEIYGDTTYVINVGKVEYDPEDQPKQIIEDYFASCNQGSIPEGWYVKFGSEERPGQTNYSSGSRMFDFAAGGDFTKGFYFREGYVEYGTTPGYDLTLEAGKRYDLSFMTAMWKDNGNKTRVEILYKETEEVAFVQVVENKPNMNGGQGAVNGATSYTFKFYPEETDNYILRFTSSDAETGDPAYKEILLAKPAIKYMPNQVGLEETQLLNNALVNAKETFEANADARYAGVAYSALEAAIVKYEAEKDGYTAPSKFTDAAADLDAKSQAVKDHRTNCDNYDAQIKKAIDVVRQNAENKFAKTELYTELQNIVGKYNGTSEWVNLNEDPETAETDPQWQLNYSYDILTNDDSLTVATAELTEIATTTSLLFTEGKSAPENANGGKATGVAVLVDRLRLGAEALKSIGIADDDADVVAALNALTDDDDMAGHIQRRLTKEVYGKIKDEGAAMFVGEVDAETGEVTTKSVDMTVFVKNPNVYKQQPNMDFTPENVPGWTTPDGYSKPGLTVGWGQPKNVEGIAEDCMLQTWGGAYRVEQTIENLPAGVYTIKAGYGERNDDGELDNSFLYVKLSDTPAIEEGGEEEIEVNFAGTASASIIGQSFPFVTQSNIPVIENITVTDGFLTIGVNAPQNSHTFFNEVQLLLVAPAEGFDYAAAYESAGIETIEGSANAKVRSVQLFDINGRRVTKAQKGLNIVRKTMSDGSVRVEKVIVK